MTFKTIMVQFDIDDAVTPRVKFAQELARRFDAHLIGFSAAEARVVMPAVGGGFMTADIMQSEIEDIKKQLEVLKEEFLDVTGANAHVSWRSGVGNPTSLLVLHTRAADLVVMGPRPPGWNIDHLRTADPATVLLSSGRPVLLASANLSPLRAENVLIAWKDTREARRAVVDALPFLTSAREVLVMTLEEDDQKWVRESTADVVRFLTRHGVKARSDVVGVGDSDNAETLVSTAREIGADLVISGGYGRSRIREWAFGGLTKSLLNDGTLNRMMSN